MAAHCAPRGLLGSLGIGFSLIKWESPPTQKKPKTKQKHTPHSYVALISHSVSYLDSGSSGANCICSGEIVGMKILQRCLRPLGTINCSHITCLRVSLTGL